MLTGGQIAVKCLEAAGVEYIFGLCGHTVIGLMDALPESSLEFVSFRHEQLAAHAADGYFRACHKPGVVMCHLGPGLTNAATGVANAALDSSAMVVISGDIPSQHFGRDAHQEFKMHGDATQFEMYKPFVKRAWRVHRVEALPDILARAFAIATTGRPGPVLVDVPMDFFSRRAEVQIPEMSKRKAGGRRIRGDVKEIERAARMLAQARRPLIYVGGGVILSEGWGPVGPLAETLGAPVAYSLMGKGVLSDGHPLCVGMSGFWGTPTANRLIREADVILAVATRFAEASSSSWIPKYTFAVPPAKLIQVDLDPQEIGKNYPVEIGLLGDAGAVLEDLLAEVRELKKGYDWKEDERLKGIIGKMESWRREISVHNTSEAVPIRPERILAEVRDLLPPDGIVVTDVGWNKNGLAQQFPVYEPMTHFPPSGLATMGFGPAAVLGAKLGRPDRKAITLIGDGAMSSVLGVLATARERNIAAVWLVMNNKAFGTIYGLQNTAYGRNIGTRFYCRDTDQDYNPDFAAVARAFDIEGLRIEKPGDLRPALKKALDSDRPVLLDVIMDRDVAVPTDGYWDILDIYQY
ncbi:MAG: thiamine pyrophosphate-binding protein [Thermodesulfobacteriota bacterium]